LQGSEVMLYPEPNREIRKLRQESVETDKKHALDGISAAIARFEPVLADWRSIRLPRHREEMQLFRLPNHPGNDPVSYGRLVFSHDWP
jgi:hypothetical protein